MKYMIRTEEDSACKLVIHADTKDQAIEIAARRLGIDASELIAIESPM